MASLPQLLAATPRRMLLAIGRARQVRLPWNAPKSVLVETLAVALADPDALRHLLPILSADEQAVLDELLLNGGRLARRYLVERHGPLRPYRPWRADEPARPWSICGTWG